MPNIDVSEYPSTAQNTKEGHKYYEAQTNQVELCNDITIEMLQAALHENATK